MRFLIALYFLIVFQQNLGAYPTCLGREEVRTISTSSEPLSHRILFPLLHKPVPEPDSHQFGGSMQAISYSTGGSTVLLSSGILEGVSLVNENSAQQQIVAEFAVLRPQAFPDRLFRPPRRLFLDKS